MGMPVPMQGQRAPAEGAALDERLVRAVLQRLDLAAARPRFRDRITPGWPKVPEAKSGGPQEGVHFLHRCAYGF